MMHVIEPVTSLDAKAALVGGTVPAFYILYVVVFYVERQQATYAAIGTDGINLLVRFHQTHVPGRHQGAGRTGLHAFAAGHTGALTHQVTHVEYDFGVLAAQGVTDNVVHLLFPAGAHATGALDTGIQVDRDRGVRQVRSDRLARLEAGREYVQLRSPVVQFRVQAVGRCALLRHVGQ